MASIRKWFKKFKREMAGKAARAGAESSAITAGAKNAELELLVMRETNKDWANSARGGRITFVKNAVFKPGDKIFTMGSCFAVEIRKALHERGFDTYPKYDEIKYDSATQMVAKMPARDNINHYNTFVIRQEFDLALGGGKYTAKDLVDLGESAGGPASGKAFRWQDPYRKMIYASNEEKIVELSSKVTDCVSTAIREADIYVITLGLTEVWKNNSNGLYINQAPRNPGSRFSFVESTYEQNYENMARVCSLVQQHFPNRRILLTVSPVPLTRTFTGRDVVVANMESKCTLRAVAARISKEFSNVIYWPSFEIALARDIFEEDGRHVRRDGIDLIVDQFLKVHL